MKLYVAEYGGYEESFILGIYDTQRKAEDALALSLSEERGFVLTPSEDRVYSNEVFFANVQQDNMSGVNWASIKVVTLNNTDDREFYTYESDLS